MRSVFCAMLLVIALIVTISSHGSARPNMDEMANMAKAIRYLEELDRYYSAKTRPRFGRSVGENKIINSIPVITDGDQL